MVKNHGPQYHRPRIFNDVKGDAVIKTGPYKLKEDYVKHAGLRLKRNSFKAGDATSSAEEMFTQVGIQLVGFKQKFGYQNPRPRILI